MKSIIQKISVLSLIGVLLSPGTVFAIPTLYAPWDYGDRWIAGNGCYGGGSYYNEGFHTGSDSYAIDFNGLLESDCDFIETDDGKKIRAVSSGTIDEINEDSGNDYGYYVILNHADGYKSRYAHLKYNPTISPGVSEGQKVYAGQVIGFNGQTGTATGPHLHFVLYNSNGTSVKPNPMDGVTLDTVDEGALVLSTNRPTFTGTINSNYTWDRFSSPIAVEGSVTLAASASLHVQPGAIVKFKDGASLVINGEFGAYGTSASRSYFTSWTDDSIGGDTNADGPSGGAADYWSKIQVNQGASVSMNYSVVRFGGDGVLDSDIYQDGGVLNVFNSTISSSSYFGIYVASGSANISNNTIKDNTDGVFATGPGTLNLNNNTFIDNSAYPVELSYGTDRVASSSGNTSSGTGQHGYLVSGAMTASQIWGSDMPYIIYSSGMTVNSGKTLTLNAGAIAKLTDAGSDLTVAGRLVSKGASNSMVYFTSLLDDSVGGDTNNAGGTPGVGDWEHIRFNSGSTASISHSVFRFGGSTVGGTYSDLYITGGVVEISYSKIASSFYFGMYKTGGTASISNSSIYDNSYGIYNETTATISAPFNWWGSSAGPYHPITNSGGVPSSEVSNWVEYNPWLTTWP